MSKHAQHYSFFLTKALATLTALGLSLGALSVGVSQPQPAAAANESIGLYFSAPLVGGTHLAGPGVVTETFNSLTSGDNCPSSIAVGTWRSTANSNVAPNNCVVSNTGSTVENGEPFIGGTISTRIWGATGFDSTVVFTEPVKYVGLWWQQGSTGNSVAFYENAGDANPVATLSSTDIVNFFNANGFNITTNNNLTFNTVDGGTHPRKHYYGFPHDYSGTLANPILDYSLGGARVEQFAYLNLFVSGDISIAKVRIYGNNFEFDNLSISTVEAGPRGDMVLVKNVLGTLPSAQVLSWSPTNTTADVYAGAHTPNVPATVTTPASGGGAISYSVLSAGNSGCTVNSSTGVVTANAAGSCIVRATAAAVGTTYYAATKDVTFTFTANVPGAPGAPTATAGDGSTNVTITPPSSGGTPASYTVTASPGGATCTITPPARSCEITGLTNGTSYTFTSTATNGAGTSAASSASNAVTPTRATPPVSPPYTGPIAMYFDVSCVPAGSAMTVTLTGERLNTIRSASVNGTNIPLSDATTTSLKLSLPAMTAGTYDVTYVSDAGVLTHQASLRVCASVNQGTVTSTGSSFQVSKRFTGYKGDRGPVMASDRRAIANFLKAHPGLTEITCIGSTSGVPAKSTDAALATARATNACKIVKELAPSISTKISTSTGRGVGQFYRAVTLTGKGVRN